MFLRLRNLVPFLCFFLFLTAYKVGDDVATGGEIPWPYSTQRVVTVKNSRGLWELGNGKNLKLFNVEMKHDSRSGFDWIRVSRLDTKTYEVVSWGEGYYRSKKKKPLHGFSSFFELSFSPGGKSDKRGRYLHMYPNGDLKAEPYMIRMVEVETNLGRVLGLSIIDYVDMDSEHYLGSRLLKMPLSCESELKNSSQLNCYIF